MLDKLNRGRTVGGGGRHFEENRGKLSSNTVRAVRAQLIPGRAAGGARRPSPTIMPTSF